MKEVIKNKIVAIKSRAHKDGTVAKSATAERDTSNSLSKSIRTKKEAESFRIAYKSAKLLAKSR